MTLSPAQDKALSIIPCFTSFLSCLGSAQIIFKVVTARKSTPYRRILWGLSSADCLCSLLYPWQAFLVPQDTSTRIWAMGNTATCTLLGFGQQIFFSSIGYNSCLSLYFCLTVRFGMPNRVVAKKYEPWMHVICIGYPLMTAVIGAAMGMFHELQLSHGCWVNDYPQGCNAQPQTCQHGTIALIFGGIPAILAFCMILVNNLLVYWHVKYTITRSRRFGSNSIVGSRNSHTTTRSSVMMSLGRRFSMSVRRIRLSSQFQHRTSSQQSINGQQTQIHQQQPQPSHHHTDPQIARIHAVATQAFFYVATFLLVYSPSALLRILASHSIFDATNEGHLFPLLLLQAILLPSQGFFNLLVYIRPTYKRTRKDHPTETRFWAFRRALYGERVQPSRHSSRRRMVTSSSDFAMTTVHRHNLMEASHKQTSLLHKYGMEDQYPANYWCSNNEDDNDAMKDESKKSNNERGEENQHKMGQMTIAEEGSSDLTFANPSMASGLLSSLQFASTTKEGRTSASLGPSVNHNKMPLENNTAAATAMTTTATTIGDEDEEEEMEKEPNEQEGSHGVAEEHKEEANQQQQPQQQEDCNDSTIDDT